MEVPPEAAPLLLPESATCNRPFSLKHAQQQVRAPHALCFAGQGWRRARCRSRTRRCLALRRAQAMPLQHPLFAQHGYRRMRRSWATCRRQPAPLLSSPFRAPSTHPSAIHHRDRRRRSWATCRRRGCWRALQRRPTSSTAPARATSGARSLSPCLHAQPRLLAGWLARLLRAGTRPRLAPAPRPRPARCLPVPNGFAPPLPQPHAGLVHAGGAQGGDDGRARLQGEGRPVRACSASMVNGRGAVRRDERGMNSRAGGHDGCGRLQGEGRPVRACWATLETG